MATLTSPTPAPHAEVLDEVARALATDVHHGLSADEAERRLRERGRNELAAENEEPWREEAFDALTEPLVLLIIAVGVLYAI